MSQNLILIRGLPGSGKSTLARFLCEPNWFAVDDIEHFEADQYFVDENGNYAFDHRRLKDAHEKCLFDTEDAIQRGFSVVVSNTFSRIWEMEPYLDLAKKYDLHLTVITCEGNYGNIHGVPEETINKMRSRWERYEG